MGVRQFSSRSTRRRAIRGAALALVGFALSFAQGQKNPDEMRAPVNRFEGTAQFKGKGGKQQNAHVTIRQWTVPGKQKVDLAEKGFLLVTLRAGKVTTTINGKEEKRVTDDFWTVPENAKLSVEATGEAAVLEVVSITVR